MKSDLARQRYLARHIEANLPQPPRRPRPWPHVLVLPAYRESPDLLVRLARSLDPIEGCLVILLLNRPDQDPDKGANSALRQALAALPTRSAGLRRLATGCDLLCHDIEQISGPTPKRQGVGLVRKIGCDIAVQWMAAGVIESEWICCTDADATLPPDYFDRLADVPSASGAAVYPFQHIPGPERHCNAATALYELRLHHYVLGLEYAASPYAYHTLGSTLAIRARCYLQVRGFPRRAGGEDFYLLNKANKLGPVTRLSGEVIALQSRLSARVPFGTGPAVAAIAGAGRLQHQPRFYHPMSFEALRVFLASVSELQHNGIGSLPGLLVERGLEHQQARAVAHVLETMGLAGAIAHCRNHAQSPDQFLRQFHQWFDAFRTLKSIHAWRDALWPDQSLLQLESLQPRLWPGSNSTAGEIAALCCSIRRHWGWISPHDPGGS